MQKKTILGKWKIWNTLDSFIIKESDSEDKYLIEFNNGYTTVISYLTLSHFSFSYINEKGKPSLAYIFVVQNQQKPALLLAKDMELNKVIESGEYVLCTPEHVVE